MGQKIANAPLGSFTAKTIFTGEGGHVEAIQEVSVASLLATRVDTGATYKYIGWALPGTLDAASDWRIARWTIANVQKLEWADGDTNMDNIWDDRASLTYV